LEIAHLHCNKRSAAQVSGDEQERPRNDMYQIIKNSLQWWGTMIGAKL
jgi:hypothetical protein